MSDTADVQPPHDPSDAASSVDPSDRKIDEDTLGERAESSSSPASKPVDEWVTGDEPMTAAQKSYLDTLAREAGEELPADLTKAQASENIDRLQQKTGRGQA